MAELQRNDLDRAGIMPLRWSFAARRAADPGGFFDVSRNLWPQHGPRLPAGSRPRQSAPRRANSRMPPRSVDVERVGPKVGEALPEFSLRDQNGHVESLKSLLGPKGAVIVFFRSADW